MRFSAPLLFLHIFPALTHALPAGAPPDSRYKMEVLATGMPQPMELELAPDGRIFFIEIAGRLRIWKPDTRSVVEAGKVEAFTEQENGLLGFALDPHFSTNGWIYLLYSPKELAGQRLSRFTITGDVMDAKSERILLTYGEQRRECCHHAGSVEFGPDGCLFISSGDNTHPAGDSAGYAPIDERPNMEAWDAQKSAANPNDLRGKILRIRPKPDGTYEIPAGNLFPQGGSLTRPEIYCMGCRNPWRMSVDAATGIVYWGEVGPDAGGDGNRGPRGYDEINQARKAGNFGWPYFIGNNFAYFDYDYTTKKLGAKFDPAHPRNDSPNNTGARDLPPAQPALIYYPYGDSPEFPVVGKGGRTACAGPVFHYRQEFEATGGFPACYDNCLLWWDWERRMVKWARLDKNASLVSIEPFTASLQCKRMLDAVFGPDGNLYFLDYGETWGANADSKLVRLSFNHGNLPPVAIASALTVSGPVPLRVRLSSEGTNDPDGDAAALRYEWRRAGSPDVLAATANAEIVIKEPGDHVLELRVTDAAGGVGTAALYVIAGNSPPEVRLEVPDSGDFFTPGKPVAWRATVRDAEEGNSTEKPDLFSSRILVSVTMDHGGAEAPGLILMKSADCFNCHAPEHRVVGPALVEIADKYRGVAGALEASADRVQKGSSGEGGPIPMLPHGHHSRAQVIEMISWVYSLKSGSEKPLLFHGLTGEITVPVSAETAAARGMVIEATFTDAGWPPAGMLTGKSRVMLRNRRIEAETNEGQQGPQTISGGAASGGKCIGAIHHGHYLRFASLNLADTRKITCRCASAGAGGVMEFRAGKPDGPLMAKLDVPVTGGWESWREIAAPLSSPPSTRADVFAVFVNPGKTGLMHLDWIRFDP